MSSAEEQNYSTSQTFDALHLRMLREPSCNFRRDIPEGGGCGSRRIPDTLECPLEEPRGADTCAFRSDPCIFEGVRPTRYVSGVLIQRD